MRIYLLCFILSFTFLSAKSQGISQKVCDTIPYKIVHQKIIFPVKINDTLVHFILDTGGQTGIMYNCMEKLGIKQLGGGKVVGDYGGNSLSYGRGTIGNIVLGDNYNIKGKEVMIFPENGFFKLLGVVGIFSGDALANCVLTIDSKKQVLVVNYPYRPERLKLEDGFEMFGGTAKHSIIKCKFGGIEQNVLFDTGAQGFFMLTSDDYKSFAQGASKEVMQGYGINGVGIGGIGKPQDMHRIVVNELDFAGKKFENVETTIGTRGQSILGLDMIKYGKVIIDYSRNRFYYLPFSSEVEKNISLDKRWDVSVLPADNGFIVTAVWGDAQNRVKYGEKVVDINGKSLDGVEQSQIVIEDIMSDIVEDKAFITVQDTLKKQRKVEIFRK